MQERCSKQIQENSNPCYCEKCFLKQIVNCKEFFSLLFHFSKNCLENSETFFMTLLRCSTQQQMENICIVKDTIGILKANCVENYEIEFSKYTEYKQFVQYLQDNKYRVDTNISQECIDMWFMILSDQGYLILHPDLHLSVTTLSMSVECIRRSILLEKFHNSLCSPTDGEYDMIPLIFGIVAHEIIQMMLVLRINTLEYLKLQVQQILKTQYENLILQTMNSMDLYTIVIKNIFHILPYLLQWYEENIGVKSKSPLKIINTEEQVISAIYGLKGRIDVVCTTDSLYKDVIPLEIKSGSYMSLSHRAQTSLYTLLQSNRGTTEALLW